MPLLAERHVPIPTKDLLSWIFDDLSYDWDAPMYIDAADPSKSISARQAKSMIRKLVAGLRRNGLKKGDTVCLHSFNHLYYPMIVLGIVAAGGYFTGTNPAYTPLELSHHVSVTRAKFILVEPELVAPMAEAIKRGKVQSPKVFLFNHDGKTDGQFPSWTTFLDHGEDDWVRFNDEYTAKNTTAMLLTTSGTTGLPKAAEISHHNLVAEHTLAWEINLARQPWIMTTIVALPMFHAAMAPLVHTSVLKAGIRTHVMRKFDVDDYMNAIQKYKPTELLMVPPVALRVVMHPDSAPEKGKYDFTCVKRAWVGAAPLDPDLQARFEKLIGGPLTQVWGMTESSCIISHTPYPDTDIGSVGRMLPNHDIKFVDDDGNEVTTPNTRGEMCVRGPNIVRGYFENPEANARDWDAEGYYHSGDVGYFDKDTGKLFIVDRKKELIKVRGFQVAPNEIEGILLAHPEIIDCAVIGLTVPSSPDAELVRACVVLREGALVSAEEIKEHVEKQLAKFKRLTGGVKFYQAIPKTASGKILKRLLREEAMKEIKAQGAKL